MNETSKKKPGLLRRLGSALSKRLVPRVPDEVSCCEFDCRRAECVGGDWERCTLRLDYAERLREQRIEDEDQRKVQK
ncbi:MULTISPECIES: hypothetical protein [unclassified Thiocapsa]|uniref:hypothetical protein n=1 Tax=unclassified Thiocapsa TaxID=2641286 RepID=UPI0035B4C71D